MTKTYKTPMLHIVSINKNDVIATSLNSLGNEYTSTDESYAPGRRIFDSWDAGY